MIDLRKLAASRALAAAAVLIFIAFTWRSPLMFYSGDDMMNMYKAWRMPVSELLSSLCAFWRPAYRPMGAVLYRFFYEAFGFHPAPLYWFSWALLIANVVLLYLFVARISGTRFHPLVTCVIASVHGMYFDLYYSAGTIYDHLSAFFCLVALWLQSARRMPLAIVLLTIAACDSKENAVALPVLLLAAELLLVRTKENWRRRVRMFIPIALSAAVTLVFILARVANTSDLNSNSAYRPHINLAALLSNLGAYLGYIVYSAEPGERAATLFLLSLIIITLTARSRIMTFGLVWFVAALLPVAFITIRAGYVLYLPMMGLAIWLADAAYLALMRLQVPTRFAPASAVIITALLCVWHAKNWPPHWALKDSPEWITTRQFTLRYPHLAHGSKLLFLTDPYPRYALDLEFNLRLMYHDDSIVTDRFAGPPNQHPRAGATAADYDHVLVFKEGAWGGGYVEYAHEWIQDATDGFSAAVKLFVNGG